MDDFTFKVLDWFYKTDLSESLGWATNSDGTITFFVGCNDLFCWGSGDYEELTESKFNLLNDIWIDLEKLDKDLGYFYATDVFACISRQQWPQSEFLKSCNQSIIDYLKENIK